MSSFPNSRSIPRTGSNYISPYSIIPPNSATEYSTSLPVDVTGPAASTAPSQAPLSSNTSFSTERSSILSPVHTPVTPGAATVIPIQHDQPPAPESDAPRKPTEESAAPASNDPTSSQNTTKSSSRKNNKASGPATVTPTFSTRGLPDNKRIEICRLLLSGWDVAQTAQRASVSKGAVYKVKQNLMKYGSVRAPKAPDSKPLGKPPKLKEDDYAALEEELRERGWMSHRKIVVWLKRHRGVSIAQCNVSRFCKKRGWDRGTFKERVEEPDDADDDGGDDGMDVEGGEVDEGIEDVGMGEHVGGHVGGHVGEHVGGLMGSGVAGDMGGGFGGTHGMGGGFPCGPGEVAGGGQMGYEEVGFSGFYRPVEPQLQSMTG